MPDRFTFEQEGTNIAVFEDGKRISTATPQLAKTKFGFTGDVPEQKTAFEQTQEAPTIDTTGTTQITTPTPAPQITVTPKLPEPKAGEVQQSFLTSVSETAQKTRGSVEEAFHRERDRLDEKIKASEEKIADLTEQEEVLLETDVKPLLDPFREELEESERERLHVNENFEANQKLVNELDQLLTEGNELIRGERSRFASRASIAAGTAKAMEDVSARAGVIQAVISARNGQINQAFTMIDRTVGAINADRQDQLTYYQTILDFYQDQKETEEGKLISLKKEDREFMAAEISLLERDMKKAEEFAENIKEAMVDPDTALLYAQAGVKLTDSPEEIAKKIGEATYAQELRDTSNEMNVKGFTFLTPGTTAPAGTETVTVTDSKGKQRTYYKAVDPTDQPGGVSLTPTSKRNLAGVGMSPADISDVERSVNDFGIEATLKAIDNEAQRLAVAEEYNALEILDQVEEELTPEGEKTIPWWQAVGNFFTGG